MSKYIDKDRVLEYIVFGVVGKDITCGDLAREIESLPTIEVGEDCISRQQAVEDIKKHADTITDALIILENFPLVTPTVSEDCISRQKAIETCDKMYPQVDRQDIKTVIKATPSVTPTERTGVWVDRQEGTFCSECDYKTNEYHNFCPNCGADMRGDNK